MKGQGLFSQAIYSENNGCKHVYIIPLAAGSGENSFERIEGGSNPCGPEPD